MNGDARVKDMDPLYGVDGIRILIILRAISLIGVCFQRLDNVIFVILLFNRSFYKNLDCVLQRTHSVGWILINWFYSTTKTIVKSSKKCMILEQSLHGKQ